MKFTLQIECKSAEELAAVVAKLHPFKDATPSPAPLLSPAEAARQFQAFNEELAKNAAAPEPEPEAAAPEPEPEPEPSAPSGEVTKNDLQVAIRDLNSARGSAGFAVHALKKAVGVGSLHLIPREKYADAMAAIKAAMPR